MKRLLNLLNMKRLLSIVYWVLPILACALWLFLEELPVEIYNQLSESVQYEYAESRKFMIFTPIIVPMLLGMYYSILYIERRFLHKWRWLLALNLVMLAFILYKCGKAWLSTDPVYAEWDHFLAIKHFLETVPFTVTSFVVLTLIRCYELPFSQPRDKWYNLFYGLPLLWIVWMRVLDFVLGYQFAFSALYLPLAGFHLWLHKKWIRRKWLLYGVSAAMFFLFSCYCIFVLKNQSAQCVFVALYFAPWFLVAPFVAKRHLS